MAEIGGISVKLRADVDSSGVVTGYDQIQKASKKVQDELKRTESTARMANENIASSTGKAASAANKATKAFKFQKGGLAQLGQQIQDVSVMAQYGADKFVILGTQGSQIASLFGPGGALFGAVIAISAAIGGTLVKSIDAANEAGKQLPTELGKRLEDIKARYEEADEASRAAFTRVEFGKLNQEYDSLQQRIDNIQQAAFEQAQAINSSGQEALTAANKIKELKQQQEDLATLMERVSRLSTEDLATQGIDLSIDGGDAGIQSRIESIKDGIDRERELYEAWRQTRAGITAGIISDEQAQAIQADIANQQRIEQNFDNLKQRLEDERTLTLENQTLTAEEKAERQKEIDQALIDAESLKNEQLEQQNQKHQDDMNAIEEKATKKRIKLAEMEKQAKLNALSSTFSNLSSLMNTESRKLFEIGKAAAVSSAVVDGYAAVQKTMASVPYPFNIPLAAAQAAASAAQVKGIMSTNFGSAGTGQSYQGGQVVNNVSQPQQATQPDRNISIALTGSSFSGDDIRGLIGAINDELGDGMSIGVTGG